ncbi:MAG TPA: DUF6455 family protein [Burkholderiales bacterium]|jgi:hypothetical protein|nr:DUF6455 family protein [Burkholderiales bacterium]
MSTLGINAAAALAGLLIVMLLILYGVLAATFRVVRDDGRLRLLEMLRRQGSAAEAALDIGGGYQAAVAVRRCMMCAHKAQCDEWSGAKRGMETFCPNADFIARVADPR